MTASRPARAHLLPPNVAGLLTPGVAGGLAPATTRLLARALAVLRAVVAPVALALVAVTGTVAGLLALAPPAAAMPAWVWPLAGPHVVSRPFGVGTTPYAPGHRGADLPSVPGAAVGSAGAGRVSYAGLLAGRGVVVVVHGALRTTYEPVTPIVSVGAPVEAGQQVGTLDPGHEGCPVAACLHWGLLRGDVYLDPVALVEAGPVRLLPADMAPAAEPAGLSHADRAATRPPPTLSEQLPPALPAAVARPLLTSDRPPASSPTPSPASSRPERAAAGPPTDTLAAAPGHRTALAGTALALLALGMGATARAGSRTRGP